MSKKTLFYLVFSVVLLNSVVAKQKVSYPAWYTEAGLEETYPSSKFIRERGEGKTKQDAENDAAAYISRYFKTEVNVSSVSKTSGVSSNGETTLVQEIDINNQITSNMELFGIKYSDSYYDKKAKTYYVVAYIDINDAWNRYEPEIRVTRNEFMAFYDSAFQEEEPVSRIKLLNDAIAAGQGFEDKLSFANALSKKLTDKNFGGDIKTLSNISSLIKKEQLANPIYIDMSDDYSGQIEAAVRQIFTQKGFTVTATKDKAAYVAQVTVDYNNTPGSSRITLYPTIFLSLEGKNGSVYAYSGTSERVVAPNENAAKRIASENLVKNINENLSSDIQSVLGL